MTVFGVFSTFYLQQPITLNQMIGFALIAAGAFFVFRAPI
ncbi:MAG TPA: DMT family protein [Xanthobacteraceae bacterium]|nr:DMT family protein [Xanthobacteraceae bacterium]